MNYSHKDVRAYAANPLHASLNRWKQNPVSYQYQIEWAEYCVNQVRWHFTGMPRPTNAEALEYANEAIAKLKIVAEELRMRIEEGNP